MTDSIETSESEAKPWAPASAPAATPTAAAVRPAHLDAAPSSFQEAMASMFERNSVAMQAAVIEARRYGAAEGMKWIVNTLAGPGLLPDPGCTDAQAYFDLHAPSITACAYTAPREPATKPSAKPAASINITLRQAEALVSFFGGHDAEVTIAGGLPGQDPGLYAWLTEDPGEGSVFLGATEVDDELAEKGRPGPAAQLDALMKLADDYAHRYSFVKDDSMPRTRAALQAALQAFLPVGGGAA